MLRLTNIYIGVQNFGYQIGQKSLFISFYGCNRECKYCNVNKDYYFVNKNLTYKWYEYDVNQLLYIISEVDVKNIVLTGGEPTLQTDLEELITALKGTGYTVTIETNAKLYDKVLTLADYVIVSIKTYSAGKPYTDMKIINKILDNCDFVSFTCLVNDVADFDFLHKHFKDIDVWVFLKFDDYDFNDFVSSFITNDNWRLCFCIDRLLRCDFENSLRRVSDGNDN